MAAVLLSGCGAGSTISGSGSPATARKSPSPTASPTPAGNGIDALTPEQVVVKARAAMIAAKSVRVKGNVVDGTEKLTFDMRLQKAGSVAAGTMTISGQGVELLRLGKIVYMKASAGFWKAQGGTAAAAAMFAGKYVKLPMTGADMQDFAQFTDIGLFAKNVLESSDMGGVTKTKPATVNGVRALGLKDTDGVLYVALDGAPYPIRLALTDSVNQGIDFLDYNKPVTASTPPAAEVLDPATLGGGN